MNENRRLNEKENNTIANEWDKIAALRSEQLSSKKDVSYEYILKPHILKEIQKYSRKNVIDIGCGTGNLTRETSEYCDMLTGIDISEESILLAKRFKEDNTTYLVSDIVGYSKKNQGDFSLAISNMSIMDMNNLDAIISSINRILIKDGVFIFTITHPSFWPKYKGYNNQAWFTYKDEHIIESDFHITNEKSTFKTTHIHRPIEAYINILIKNAFTLERINELMPDNKDLSKFEIVQKYPRFLSFTFRK